MPVNDPYLQPPRAVVTDLVARDFSSLPVSARLLVDHLSTPPAGSATPT